MTAFASPAAGNHAQARRFANAANRWETPIDVKVEHVVRRFRDTYAIRDVSLDIRAGELLGAARAIRLRQDDAASHPGGARPADLRPRDL